MKRVWFFLLITVSLCLFAQNTNKKITEYKQFVTFQRIQLDLLKDSTVEVTANEKAQFIDLRIRKAPKNIAEIIRNAIKSGPVVSKYSWRKDRFGIFVRIFVKPESLNYFHGFDRKTGVFILDVGEKRVFNIVSDKERTDVKLSGINIDMYLRGDQVKASLLFHTFNFYFIDNDEIPFVSDPIEFSVEFPYLEGNDKDIRLYNTAANAYNKNKLSEAEKALDTLYAEFKKTPIFSLSNILKADVLRLLAKKNKANIDKSFYLDLYEKYRIAVSTYPRSYMAAYGYLQMGQIMYKLDMFVEGARDFKAVSEKYPESDFKNVAVVKHVEFLLMKKQNREAVKMLTKIKNPESDYVKIAKNGLLGIAHFMNGKKINGIKYLKKAAKHKNLEVASDTMLMTAGELLMINGEYTTARSFFQTLVNTYPKSPFASIGNFRLADTYLTEGNIKAAVKEYQDTLNKHRQEEGGRLAKVQIDEIEHFLQNEEPELEFYFRSMRAAKEHFEYSVLLFKLALKFYRTKKIEHAVHLLALLLERYPESIVSAMAKNLSNEILRKGIQRLYDNEDYETIVNFFQMIPEYMMQLPDIGSVLIILGKSFNRLTMYSDAAKVFNEILKMRSSEDPFIRSIAVLNLLDNYIQAGDEVRAQMTVDYYKDFMNDKPDVLPVFLRLLGDYEMKLAKNKKMAISYYKKSLKADPYAINKLILSDRLADIYYEDNDFDNVIKYTEAGYYEYKKHPNMYDVLQHSATLHLTSLLMKDRYEEFENKFVPVEKHFSHEIKDMLNLLRLIMYIGKRDMKMVANIKKGINSEKIKPYMKSIDALIKSRKDIMKSRKILADTLEKYNRDISWLEGDEDAKE